ncbi:protein farnesyltransferase subunit beta-like [Styela clava]
MEVGEIPLRQLTPADFFDDEGTPTKTTVEQQRVEESVLRKLKDFEDFSDLEPGIHLKRDDHLPYLLKGLERLSEGYECLDASQPWLCYWIVHSLSLLGHELSEQQKSSVVKFLEKCQSPTGGYGGGPEQFAHLAPTYAAVNCLCIIATDEAYESINREKLLYFLFQMRQNDGSFTMHEGGESDTRSLYCAISVASLTGLDEIAGESLFAGSPQYIVSCQTYEGGIGGCPGAEAHGGYTFCGYAGLVILGHEKLIDTDRMLRWLVNKQMRIEGGFQGRTNKLVDGCYSFWQGGVFPLIQNTLLAEGCKSLCKHNWLFNQQALQEYLLISCQSRFGGLIDKPGKSPDYYHTCYCLSGLTIAQHPPDLSNLIIGEHANNLVPTHPAYNIEWEYVTKANEYFTKRPLKLSDEMQKTKK